MGRQVFAHTVPVTDDDIRSHTTGDYLKHGQQLGSWTPNKVGYSYQGKQREPLIWTNSSDNLSFASGVHACEEPDAI